MTERKATRRIIVTTGLLGGAAALTFRFLPKPEQKTPEPKMFPSITLTRKDETPYGVHINEKAINAIFEEAQRQIRFEQFLQGSLQKVQTNISVVFVPGSLQELANRRKGDRVNATTVSQNLVTVYMGSVRQMLADGSMPSDIYEQKDPSLAVYKINPNIALSLATVEGIFQAAILPYDKSFWAVDVPVVFTNWYIRALKLGTEREKQSKFTPIATMTHMNLIPVTTKRPFASPIA